MDQLKWLTVVKKPRRQIKDNLAPERDRELASEVSDEESNKS
jgi:hypothetical protein